MSAIEKQTPISRERCWILTEHNKRGTLNQCLGLARAAGFGDASVKLIGLKAPWRFITPYIKFFSPSHMTAESDNLYPPFPELVIAAGRKAVAPALWIKKQSGGATKVVFLQNPKAHVSKFDLVIAPEHDKVYGSNVLSVKTGLHHVTPELLKEGKEQFTELFKPMAQPRIGVLIGGNSKHHTMTPEITKELADRLVSIADDGFGLMITASRRTGEENEKILTSAFEDHDNVYFWDGSGDNPYFGILGWSDVVIVTEDSVSMTTEAIATGKPVYVVPFEGGSPRLDYFQDSLREAGATRLFKGRIEQWEPTPLNVMEDAASAVKSVAKQS